MSANPDGRDRWWGALFAVTVALPAGLAVAHAANVADAAHDEAVLRALGLGWTGALRALDAPWCGLFAWLPAGTRATRAALASAVACGVGGGALFVMARELLARCAVTARVGSVVAALAALAATLSPSWQLEAAAPAGGTFGALLALAPAAILLGAPVGDGRVPLACLALGGALSYEPLVGLAALASIGAFAAALAGGERRALLTKGALVRGAIAFAVGIAPLAIAFARRTSPIAMAVGPFAGLAGEHGESAAGIPMALVRDDVGIVTSLLAVAGAVLGARSVRARPATAALAALACVGGLAMLLGAPAGPTRYGAPVIAGVGAACALAGVAMQAIVVAVAQARIPFARASAAMILVLEAALPARAADDSSARAEERSKGAGEASETWDDAAWGALPAGAMVLIRDRSVETRLYSTRGSGELRADLALVPLFDLAGRGAMRELTRDPKLSPIWRDAALLGAQEEWSLSQLAQERPLVAAYDPAWDRSLARHLVPVGLFARFEPEPRGGSDRRRALEELPRDRLVKAVEGDPELLGLTVRLLRARLVALAAASERDIVAHAIDDLRPFSPRDPVAGEIVRRMTTSRGAIDVKDLTP
ncbi:MAG: hypothetical protein ACLQVI_00405 [Polyangiaceae bacterium]